jgi:hypothetical protein
MEGATYVLTGLVVPWAHIDDALHALREEPWLQAVMDRSAGAALVLALASLGIAAAWNPDGSVALVAVHTGNLSQPEPLSLLERLAPCLTSGGQVELRRPRRSPRRLTVSRGRLVDPMAGPSLGR